MPLDPTLVAAMRQTINVRHVLTLDGRGKPATFSAWVAAAARVEPRRRTVFGADGRTLSTTHRLVTQTEVRPNSQIMLPAYATADPVAVPPDASKALTPAAVDEGTGEEGAATLFYEVTL